MAWLIDKDHFPHTYGYIIPNIGNGNKEQASGDHRMTTINVEEIHLHGRDLHEDFDLMIGAARIAVLETATERACSGITNSINFGPQ